MIFFFTVCIGKSTFVLLTPLIPVLGSPLINRCCRCAGIVLQNGCQVTNRVTDVCGESVIHGITSGISRQRAGCVCVCVCVLWLILSVLTSIKEDVFCNFELAHLPCLHPPPPASPRVEGGPREGRVPGRWGPYPP
jgi:hypothetical protein